MWTIGQRESGRVILESSDPGKKLTHAGFINSATRLSAIGAGYGRRKVDAMHLGGFRVDIDWYLVSRYNERYATDKPARDRVGSKGPVRSPPDGLAP